MLLSLRSTFPMNRFVITATTTEQDHFLAFLTRPKRGRRGSNAPSHALLSQVTAFEVNAIATWLF